MNRYTHVIRNGSVIQIPTHEIAVGDLCIIEEGKMINADGVIVHSNVFLSLTNRSFVFSVLDSFKYKNRLFPIILGTTLIMLFALLYIPPFARFFQLTALGFQT